MNYAVIGAGISDLAAAAMLRETGHDVTVFEKEERLGGLIRCERVEGCLFHRTGGHVFNTKRDDVLEWFWRKFDREAEFTKTSRNSTIAFENPAGGTFCVPYPIEDHVYMLDEATKRGFIRDLLSPSAEALWEEAPLHWGRNQHCVGGGTSLRLGRRHHSSGGASIPALAAWAGLRRGWHPHCVGRGGFPALGEEVSLHMW